MQSERGLTVIEALLAGFVLVIGAMGMATVINDVQYACQGPAYRTLVSQPILRIDSNETVALGASIQSTAFCREDRPCQTRTVS